MFIVIIQCVARPVPLGASINMEVKIGPSGPQYVIWFNHSPLRGSFKLQIGFTLCIFEVFDHMTSNTALRASKLTIFLCFRHFMHILPYYTIKMTSKKKVVGYFFVPEVLTVILRYCMTYFDEVCILRLHCSTPMTSQWGIKTFFEKNAPQNDT